MDGELTGKIIGAAMEVHSWIGPGLLESVYQQCLCRELFLRKIPFVEELTLPIQYKGVRLDCDYRLDLLVDSAVVVEIKAVRMIEPVHQSQLLTYMKLGGWKCGLLINFHVAALKHGIRRLVL